MLLSLLRVIAAVHIFRIFSGGVIFFFLHVVNSSDRVIDFSRLNLSDWPTFCQKPFKKFEPVPTVPSLQSTVGPVRVCLHSECVVLCCEPRRAAKKQEAKPHWLHRQLSLQCRRRHWCVCSFTVWSTVQKHQLSCKLEGQLLSNWDTVTQSAYSKANQINPTRTELVVPDQKCFWLSHSFC